MNASVKNNRTFFTNNTITWVYTKTPTWELIGTVRWIHIDTLMWELIGKDNGLMWVYTNTPAWELNRYGRTSDVGRRTTTTTHFKSFQSIDKPIGASPGRDYVLTRIVLQII